jgi:hypothetical protein
LTKRSWLRSRSSSSPSSFLTERTNTTKMDVELSTLMARDISLFVTILHWHIAYCSSYIRHKKEDLTLLLMLYLPVPSLSPLILYWPCKCARVRLYQRRVVLRKKTQNSLIQSSECCFWFCNHQPLPIVVFVQFIKGVSFI